jgi:hypothetical protein
MVPSAADWLFLDEIGVRNVHHSLSGIRLVFRFCLATFDSVATQQNCANHCGSKRTGLNIIGY